MHAEHEALLKQLHAAGRGPDGRFDAQAYLGTGSHSLNVSVPARRKIARDWRAAHKDWPTPQVLALVDELVQGDTHEEKTLGLLILEFLGPARRPFGPAEVDRWLGHLVGWAEVDSLCQSMFGPDDMLGDWPAWSARIRELARDPNINKRRAALVLLTRPTRTSPDPRLSALAFEVIDKLKAEKPIIITKAVSWLLRSLADQHREALADYLEAEQDNLPKIAVRETRAKLKTGRKTRAKA
jgi:3-methyladenine DNA glycosylase AlkD